MSRGRRPMRRGEAGLRRWTAALFALGATGTGAELLLLGHFEDWRQGLPLGALGAGLFLLVVWGLTGQRWSLRAFRAAMGACLVAGGYGLWLHLGANVEFEKEMYPDRAGWELLWEAARGALPVLAPGALVQLGLLGLIYAWRHPGLNDGEGTV